MSKSTRQIVAGILSFAMVLTLVVGFAAAPAGAQTVTFDRNLTVGSRGADVMQLQTTLQAKGFFTVEPTGYFGTITKRAVAAWQASEGISPAAGYFGPISRAQMNAGTGTGTGTTVPGCPAGAVYNYLTGALCTPASGTTTTGTEGTLTVTASPTPANNANIQSSTDIPVYGLDLKAKLGDVTVNRMDLDVAVTNSGATENPGNFINTIKLMSGSTVVKSWAVGTADFNVGTTSTHYYVRLSNIGFVVPKDTTKTLTVTFNTNAGIDNNRTVTIYGYGTNSLLTTSGNNINSYYDISGINRTHTFQKPGVSSLTVAADVSNPLSQTYRINKSSNSSANVTMMTFAVKSETGDSKITSVSVLATSSNTYGPTALYLYDGSTLLGSWSASTWVAQDDQTATFSNLTLNVPKDTTKTLTVTGDFAVATTDGTIASTTVSSVTYEKPNGSSVTSALRIQGNNHYFYSVSPQWTLLSTSITAPLNTVTGTTSALNGKFVLKVKPLGGTMDLPEVNDFYVNVASSTSSLHITSPAAVTVSGSPTALAENVEYTVTIDVTAAANLFAGVMGANTGMWFTLTGATSTFSSTTTQQTWGLNNFKTDSIIPSF